MTEVITSTLIGIVSALGTGTITWLFARKRNMADLTKAELENIDIAAGMWQRTVDMLEKHLATQTEAMDALRAENISLKNAVYELQSEMSELKNQNKKLLCKLNKLEKYEKKISDNIDIPSIND